MEILCTGDLISYLSYKYLLHKRFRLKRWNRLEIIKYIWVQLAALES